jgi:hypothetical protein
MRYGPSPSTWLTVFAITFAIAIVTGGCEAIVPDSVPSFTCAGLKGTCPGGQVCVMATGTCIDQAKACSFAGCGAGKQCDTPSQVCIPVAVDASVVPDAFVDPGDATPPPNDVGVPVPDSSTCRGIGCPCAGASACDSAICGDQLTITPELYTATKGNVCTKPCCSSSDCDAGSVCFAAGDGGNYCVTPDVLGRSTPGAKKGGDTCAAGTDCRSGVCGAGGACEDTCCSIPTAACAGATTCRFAKFAGKTSFDTHYTFTCSATNAPGNPGDACNVGSDCKTNLCFAATQFGSSRCRQPCRGTLGCAPGYACSEVLLSGLQLQTNDLGVVCFPPAGAAGAGALGTACVQDTDCRSQSCDRTLKRCTDACFGDADCTAVAGWRCRPTIVQVQGGGSYSVLGCGP